MRWFSTLLTAALSLSATAAAAKKDVFAEYNAKQHSSVPVKITDSSYKKLTAAPRDYAAAILLTALDPRFACQLCHDFQPEWDILSSSWVKGDKKAESRTVFGTLDFTDGRETFMSLGLQTAPVLLLFQPTTGPHAVASAEPLRYDFASGNQKAEAVHAWIARQLEGRPHPPIRRPVNYVKIIVTIVSALGVVGAIAKIGPYLLPIAQNRNLWATISLLAILLFTSGHMFNQIRKVPYVAGNGKGGVSYFAGGFQSQYGLETQIIAFLFNASDGLMSFATIYLAVRAPRLKDRKLQQLMIIGWGVLLFCVYSFLLSIFRMKNGGYPFRLPPFF
ncbi:OST3/OST6 family protein [Microdochium trichocladiopsis]|uniref:OST3/OST6 family protein n=1 Tax=Microdochium trichocladiopsis TaxID=1682393 RepID=A0A9P8XZZ9_9PEZI|nr:OST3/OST6 family protein [Microdochium trichocladiopsis]KAH7026223.1 OST3/OST6 family protein [Microdochium trichocladiopsis]